MLNEVLNCKHVHAHLLTLLHEALLRHHEVLRYECRPCSLSHRHLVLDLFSLSLRSGQWWNISLPHVADKLSRQLIKRFLSQKRRVMLEVIERNKLDNVGGSVPPQLLAVKSLVVTIKLVHHLEISIANTDNDDRNWVVRTANNLVDRCVHIIDHTVSNDEHDLELLIVEVARICLRNIVHLIEDGAEVSWPIQVHIVIVDAVLVVLRDFG